MTKDEALRMAQDLRALADRLNDGWHEGIKIDASDIVLLADAAEALAEQPEQEPEKEVTITCSCGDKFYVPLDELIKQLQEDKRQKFPKRFDTHPAPERRPLKMWTEAEHKRAYRNSPELHKDVKTLAAFKRVAKEIAAMYGITGESK